MPSGTMLHSQQGLTNQFLRFKYLLKKLFSIGCFTLYNNIKINQILERTTNIIRVQIISLILVVWRYYLHVKTEKVRSACVCFNQRAAGQIHFMFGSQLTRIRFLFRTSHISGIDLSFNDVLSGQFQGSTQWRSCYDYPVVLSSQSRFYRD